MPKRGKKYRAAKAKVDSTRRYTLEEAVDLVLQTHYARFDETVEVAVRLGVDPRHADQMVRGAVVLPHGLGKTWQRRSRKRGGSTSTRPLPPRT